MTGEATPASQPAAAPDPEPAPGCCAWCGATPTKTVKVGRDTGPACDRHAEEARRDWGATVTPLT